MPRMTTYKKNSLSFYVWTHVKDNCLCSKFLVLDNGDFTINELSRLISIHRNFDQKSWFLVLFSRVKRVKKYSNQVFNFLLCVLRRTQFLNYRFSKQFSTLLYRKCGLHTLKIRHFPFTEFFKVFSPQCKITLLSIKYSLTKYLKSGGEGESY